MTKVKLAKKLYTVHLLCRSQSIIQKYNEFGCHISFRSMAISRNSTLKIKPNRFLCLCVCVCPPARQSKHSENCLNFRCAHGNSYFVTVWFEWTRAVNDTPRGITRFIALRWPVTKMTTTTATTTVLRLIAHNYLGIRHILYLTNVIRIRVFFSTLRSISARLNAIQIDVKLVLSIIYAHTDTLTHRRTHLLSHEHVTRHLKRFTHFIFIYQSVTQTLIFSV